MLIESPRQLLLQKNSEGLCSLQIKSPDILEEVIPLAARGKELNHVVANAGCNAISFIEYETSQLPALCTNACRCSQIANSVPTVTFKRDICRNEFK